MKSIRTKLIFWICILFVLIGILIFVPLWKILPQKIVDQILKRDAEIAQYLANEAKEPLLLDDKISLSLLLHDNKDRLEDVEYLFIQASDGTIISHTFDKGFPRGLMNLGVKTKPGARTEYLNKGRKIYDIAVPILAGELGVLHFGVSLESGKKDIAEVAKIYYYVALIIIVGLGIGVGIFLTIGFIFSNQIIKLKDAASEIGKGNLEAKIDIESKDEIGELALEFNDMAKRLKEKIREIKRLNIIEERNRIALDLHDGCAQDMASIIKRLELCEKLLIKNPLEAVKEFEALKGNAQNILNRTRWVIFDLKSHENADLNLLDKVNRYVAEFKKENGINIELNISGAVENIQGDKVKSIFYVITEALANIRKHSQAKNAVLTITKDAGNDLLINVKDDGKGFDVNSTKFPLNNGRWGLIGMSQRANCLGGTFSVESIFQQGTKVSVTVPIQDELT